MYQSYVASVLGKYGIEYAAIQEPQKGYRNEIYPIVLANKQVIQLTFFKFEPEIQRRIKRSDAVSEYASMHGLPTRLRYDQRMVQLKNSSHTVMTSLYNYLPGETISWEAYTQTHIKLLGQSLGKLHHLLDTFEYEDNVSVINESMQLLKRMSLYFQQEPVADAMARKLGVSLKSTGLGYEVLLILCKKLPAQQLHMDFVRGNILFETTHSDHALQLDEVAVSGILDFEKTAYGPKIFDIARTLAFLLVDCKYKTEDQVQRYFLQSGYIKRGQSPIDAPEKMLMMLVEFYLVHDFYKFLRHNPFENLVDNEHFIRTKDILIKRGVIHYV